jgi:hypothetical protein
MAAGRRSSSENKRQFTLQKTFSLAIGMAEPGQFSAKIGESEEDLRLTNRTVWRRNLRAVRMIAPD